MACTPERSTLLYELAAGQLDADALDELLGHVEACRPCSLELDDVAGVLAASVDGRATAGRPAVPRLAAPWTRLSWLVGAAAALLCALLLLTRGDESDAQALAQLADTTPLAAAPGVLRGDAADDRAHAALALYAAGRWAAAAEALAAARSAGDERPLVALYLGLARLQFDPATAREPLADAAERGAGLLAERALWYLAQAHLVRGDADAARGALEALAARAGDYELNARELLDALDAR